MYGETFTEFPGFDGHVGVSLSPAPAHRASTASGLPTITLAIHYPEQVVPLGLRHKGQSESLCRKIGWIPVMA